MNGVRFLALIVIWAPGLAKYSSGTAPTNLALNKRSSQISTHTYNSIDFVASLANDGNLATQAITKARSVTPSWWFVDLKGQVHVTLILIKLYQTWPNLQVGVGNNEPTDTSVPGQDFTVCKKFTRIPDDWIQTVRCYITGRYVILFAEYRLMIIEVEVYNTTETGVLGIGQLNLAREKTAYLSSSIYDGNDGNQYGNDGNPTSRAMTDRAAPLPTYWYVDLGERLQITSIVLLFAGEWTNLTVGVGDDPPINTSRPWIDFRVCHMFPGYPDNDLVNIPVEESGRYVIIFSEYSSTMQIIEVEVYNTTKQEQSLTSDQGAEQDFTRKESITDYFTLTEGNEAELMTTSLPKEPKWNSKIPFFIGIALLLVLVVLIVVAVVKGTVKWNAIENSLENVVDT